MNVREYLKEYGQSGEEIRRLNSELNKLIECREDTYNTLQAQIISDMPRSACKDGDDTVSKAVLKIYERYTKSIDNLVQQINEILYRNDLFNQVWNMAGLLDINERKVIELRYFQGREWSGVSQQLFFCEKQCRRISIEAISKLQQEINKKLYQAI